ncbi:acetyltransferase [Lichenifustis flavocetrariae]|uniref:Acetyltransferase n=1 Tax=Lichenifustis flavocetrariae TaxID=2949735 RepID=A0AA41YUU5_9HYPH|nr:acetyltransferase [Lichenifustis flavocetrariae]MCW6508544.1 acetyltransferase [Lichenifustis flavocetrariae]
MGDLVIIGAGGSSRDIIDLVGDINRHASDDGQRWEIRGLLDDDQSKLGQIICGVPVIGSISKAADVQAHLVVGIASHRNRRVRKAVVERLALDPARYATLVHPSASVSSWARIGAGTVVLQNVVIGPQVTLGRHVLISAGVTIGHDTAISDYVSTASQVGIAGGVVIRESVYIGIGACLREGVEVGEGSLIGMGSVVTRNVEAGRTVVGNPARRHS